MRYIFIIVILSIFFNYSFISTALINKNFLNGNEIQKNINYITQKNISNIEEKEQIIKQLKSALNAISDIERSKAKIKEYQNIIDNFPNIIHQLHCEKTKNTQIFHKENNHTNNDDYQITSSNKLRKNQITINQKLEKLNQEIQQEQNLAQLINNSLVLLPQQHTETQKKINEIERKISKINTIKKTSHLEQAKLIALQAKKESKKFKITELEFAQLSANNRQEISRLHIELLKNKYDQLEKKSHILHIKLHSIREQETTQTIENIEILSKNTKNKSIFPESIIRILQTNHKLSKSLKKQIDNINLITLQQREITSHTLKTQQALTHFLKYAQWITKSKPLGETLRAQISKLPKSNIYKTQKLDNKMTTLREQRLQYEEQINSLPFLISLQNNKENKNLTKNQKNILNTQINIQRKLLNSLLTNCDIQILELTKLKISYEQLQNIIKDIDKATNQYLFWIADTYPITLSYPSKIYQDLYLLFDKNILHQLTDTIKKCFSKNIFISVLLLIYTILICWTQRTYHRYYYTFLEEINQKLKNDHKTYFLLTLKNIFWANIISLPFPILWFMIGYNLSKSWEHPTFFIIGEKIIYFAPVLWFMITIRYFSSKNGLFLLHFKWDKNTINNIMINYNIYIMIIVLIFITLITFNSYHDQKFYSTLGRCVFITLCFFLTYTTYFLKKENIFLYINKNKPNNKFINNILWNLLIILPIIVASISYFGYLTLSQKLLINIEISIIISIISLITYYTIQCWIITQKYQNLHTYQKNHINTPTEQNLNIEKKLLSPILFHHIKNLVNINPIKKNNEKQNNIINLINNKLLQFIKSAIILTTLTIIFFLWSDFHFIFNPLKKILEWDITSTIHGTKNIQPITLKAILTIILIFFITTKTIKNLPSLLEITILQYLNLTTGTNYAIITFTKYITIILGIIIGSSYIGLSWSKFQWLIAAIGVGLGFGLQEIFANFISGLIILFEKPIRIGDTVTICNLTGNITKINTRATRIIDRNHKEIIIPNKEFITKKFINWSLSDTITRVVLKVPAPSESNISQVIQILSEAIISCPLVLQTPKPEIYLTDIQQGTPLFEIRMYTSKINYRMALLHQVHILIIELYKKNGLHLPFPHINIHNKEINNIKKEK